MKSKIKNVAELKSVYKLDPTSDRYRICPECKIAFMTKHRGSDFHTPKCADDYNNRIKKLNKHANDLIEASKLTYAPQQPQEVKAEIKQEIITPVVSVVAPPIVAIATQVKSAFTPDQVTKKKNDQILSETLGDKLEVNRPWTDLVQQGLDPRAYDSIEKLPRCNLFKANYGNYAIVWTSPDLILLTTQKQLLWTLTLTQ